MTRENIGDHLALLNAILNGTSALLLISGRFAIANKRTKLHRGLMLAALTTSATFLVSYLTRVALTGTHVDPHHGAVHALYLTVLITHMILAVAVRPHGSSRRSGSHVRTRGSRSIAGWRWRSPSRSRVHVSVTGVRGGNRMLYQVAGVRAPRAIAAASPLRCLAPAPRDVERLVGVAPVGDPPDALVRAACSPPSWGRSTR